MPEPVPSTTACALPVPPEPDDVESGRRLFGAHMLRARGRRRQASVIEKMDEIVALPGRTRLETLAVGRATRRQYLTTLWLLASWCLGLSDSVSTGSDLLSVWDALLFLKEQSSDDLVLDDMIAGFLDACHWAGVHSGVGGRVTSALGFLLPRHHRDGDGRLPRSHQARSAATRRAPGGTRYPYPEIVVYGLVMVMLYELAAAGLDCMPAVCVLLMHHCYLRPCEMVSLRWRYLVPAMVKGRMRVVATLHPLEQLKASKTGEFDETVVIDLPELVAFLVLRRQELNAVNGPVLPLAMLKLFPLFERAQTILGVTAPLGRQTMYVLRHSGASADAWLERRSLLAIQRRGRWKSSASVRRYEKSGRVAERVSLCSDLTLAFCARCEERLGDVLAGRCKPLRPP